MRIVIAEDEPKSREGLINIIHRFTDYEIVGVADDGIEGLELVLKMKPDLVISDIKSRDWTDWECWKKSKKNKWMCRLCFLPGIQTLNTPEKRSVFRW